MKMRRFWPVTREWMTCGAYSGVLSISKGSSVSSWARVASYSATLSSLMPT